MAREEELTDKVEAITGHIASCDDDCLEALVGAGGTDGCTRKGRKREVDVRQARSTNMQ